MRSLTRLHASHMTSAGPPAAAPGGQRPSAPRGSRAAQPQPRGASAAIASPLERGNPAGPGRNEGGQGASSPAGSPRLFQAHLPGRPRGACRARLEDRRSQAKTPTPHRRCDLGQVPSSLKASAISAPKPHGPLLKRHSAQPQTAGSNPALPLMCCVT